MPTSKIYVESTYVRIVAYSQPLMMIILMMINIFQARTPPNDLIKSFAFPFHTCGSHVCLLVLHIECTSTRLYEGNGRMGIISDNDTEIG